MLQCTLYLDILSILTSFHLSNLSIDQAISIFNPSVHCYPSIHPSIYPSFYHFIHLSIHPSINWSIHPSFHSPFHPLFYTFVHLIYPSFYSPLHLFIHPSMHTLLPPWRSLLERLSVSLHLLTNRRYRVQNCVGAK